MKGYEKGQNCNRNGCIGIIKEHEKEGSCSCHISPPCSYCVEDNSHCPECDWSGKEEQDNCKPLTSSKFTPFKVKTLADLDSTKIDWINKSHTNFSMIRQGVYPEGTEIKDVLSLVKGTFGGRFEYFQNGKFKYIAYTN